ncbi:hypothetical protein SDC9_63254 [bioreactor metagenome]|uniref:Uncharacterized protein n=1 Tax=bioreactor metagenome TaxID=1076179 RepID=A0A644XL07_9ZZZZ
MPELFCTGRSPLGSKSMSSEKTGRTISGSLRWGVCPSLVRKLSEKSCSSRSASTGFARFFLEGTTSATGSAAVFRLPVLAGGASSSSVRVNIGFLPSSRVSAREESPDSFAFAMRSRIFLPVSKMEKPVIAITQTRMTEIARIKASVFPPSINSG